MNHLIVMPRIVSKIGEWYQFPLGIAYISAALKKAGFKVYTLNLNNEHGSVIDILREKIQELDIATVSTGGVTGQYGAIREVLESAKQINPEIITITGGGLISSAPEDAMTALEYADFGVIGEGEIIICELCTALENDTDPTNIPGIIYKQKNGYSRTIGNPSPVILENVPFPDYHGFGFHKLLESVPNIIGMSEYNTLPIITGRSCPFRCTFCFHTSGQKFRQRALDDVFAEIDYLVSEYGVKYLSIQDELFLFGKSTQRIEEFCQRIKPYGIKWLAQFRVNDVTPELVAMLKDANCATMAFGIESADNSILKSMKKGIRIEQTERALEIVYQAGIGIQGVLIFGDPAETLETATRTLNWWKEHRHYELQLSAVITYPGTAIYKQACIKGIIADPIQYIKDGCPLVRLSDMSDSEYAWLFQQIASLPRTSHSQPNNAEILNADYQLSRIDVVGNCVACGHENHWEKNRLFVTETLACIKCGRKHVSPIPDDVVTRVTQGINYLVEKYGKVAIWGINSYIFSLSEKLSGISPEQVVYVDKSKMRHGLDVSGHIVKSTDIIRDENIKVVIVAVVQYYSGLIGPIREEFPGIERLLCISDLLADDFISKNQRRPDAPKPGNQPLRGSLPRLQSPQTHKADAVINNPRSLDDRSGLLSPSHPD
jgi:radical SAM superfamily enzyme YgiQ (UPF0313 family)